MITKEEIERLANVKIIKKGGDFYCGHLNLYGKKNITELPNNLNVLGYLNLCYSSVTKLPKGLDVELWMSISGTNIEELPEDAKIGGSLDINGMKKPFLFPNIVKVNGRFNCSNTTIKHMPEELYVSERCDFSYSIFNKLPNVMEVGDSLCLAGASITELPESINEVYGDFNLCNTKISKLPNNLVTYNDLFLNGTPITELSKGLIVGGKLYLYNTILKNYSNLHKHCSKFQVTNEKYEEIKNSLGEHSKRNLWGDDILVTFEPNYNGAYLFENESGKYIKADGIFGKIVEQKGDVYHVKLSKSEEISYLVTDGNGYWVHDYTLDKAKDELIFINNKKNKDDYWGLTLKSELSFEDAIMCYRVITNESKHINSVFEKNKKDRYTIKEIIKITKGEYGGRIFRSFFL